MRASIGIGIGNVGQPRRIRKTNRRLDFARENARLAEPARLFRGLERRV